MLACIWMEGRRKKSCLNEEEEEEEEEEDASPCIYALALD